jgi:hypothetical protein
VDLFNNTGQSSHKVFMVPDKIKIKGTKKMELELNLCKGASKMNIVPHLHLTLISNMAVFKKEKASIYNTTMTTIPASMDPILVAPRCQDTGLWKLDLDYQVKGHE